MTGRPGLRSGGLLRDAELTDRTGEVRISGSGRLFFTTYVPTVLQLRRTTRSSLQGRAFLRRGADVPAATSGLLITGDGEIRVTGLAGHTTVFRLTGGGEVTFTGGNRTEVPATSVGSWRS